MAYKPIEQVIPHVTEPWTQAQLNQLTLKDSGGLYWQLNTKKYEIENCFERRTIFRKHERRNNSNLITNRDKED